MFELNSHMIQKMGWWLYYPNLGLGLDYPGLFTNDYMVRFFFIDKERERIFIIKEKSIIKIYVLFNKLNLSLDNINSILPTSIFNLNSSSCPK